MADLYHLLDDLQEETQGTINEDTTTTQDEQEQYESAAADDETRNVDDLRQQQERSISSSIIPPALQLEEKKRQRQSVLNRQSMGTERTADETFDKLTMDSSDMMSLSGGFMDDDDDHNNDIDNDEYNLQKDYDLLIGKEKMLAKTQYAQLRQYWINEMNSPELQPYDTELIQSMMEHLMEQDELIEQYNTNHQENDNDEDDNQKKNVTTGNKNLDALFGSMLRIDTERVKFILCDLLQQRIHKIERYPLYMRDEIHRMSSQEIEFLKQYGALMEDHLNQTVLNHMTQAAFQRLDESYMMDQPNLNQFVFMECIQDNIHIGMEKKNTGDQLIVRYQLIRKNYQNGEVELLL